MRALLCLFVFLSLALATMQSCRTDQPDATLQQNDSLHLAFYDDACRIALRHVRGTRQSSIPLPTDSITYYLNRLVDVYAFIEKNRVKDSLQPLLDIHAFNNPSPYNLTLHLDPAVPWMQAWNNSMPESGDKDVNRLIKAYTLRLQRYHDEGTSAYAEINSVEPLNTFALAEAFSKIHGIRSAEPSVTVGGNQDINAQRNKDGVKFIMMKGKGDCTSGCIYKKTWEFQVDHKERVQYLGSRGFLPADSVLRQ